MIVMSCLLQHHRTCWSSLLFLYGCIDSVVLCLICQRETIIYLFYYHTFDLLVSINLIKCYILLHVPLKFLTNNLRGMYCCMCHFVKHFELHVLYEMCYINKALLLFAHVPEVKVK